MTEQEYIYTKYLAKLKLKLIEKYNELGLRAHGKYEEELEPVVSPNSMKMLGAHHSYFMENGRGTGYVAPRIILEWIEVKDSLPPFFRENKHWLQYAIAARINKEGIVVPNIYNRGKVVSAVIEDFLADEIGKMLDEIGEVYLTSITSDVIKILNEITLQAA